jgi:hypothetical protein
MKLSECFDTVHRAPSLWIVDHEEHDLYFQVRFNGSVSSHMKVGPGEPLYPSSKQMVDNKWHMVRR